MSVKAAELLAIDAKRYARSPPMGQVRIDHNSTVTLVREAGPSSASVEFRYTASYGALGLITIEGSLLWEGSPSFDAKKLADAWRQSAQMPPDVASEIHTTVMRVCLPEAVAIAKDLQLPPPIPMPQVKFQEPPKPSSEAKTGGPEVA